jgi:hypothetical protein
LKKIQETGDSETNSLRSLHLGKKRVKVGKALLSKQFRNVPFLTPLEMSPFGVSALFLSVLLIFLQEFRVGFWSIYSIPVYVVWLGPERNPA